MYDAYVLQVLQFMPQRDADTGIAERVADETGNCDARFFDVTRDRCNTTGEIGDRRFLPSE